MKSLILKSSLFLFMVTAVNANAQSVHKLTSNKPLSVQMAATVLEKEAPPRWSYDHGVVLEGLEALWKRTGDTSYFNYIRRSMDKYVSADGTIASYSQDAYSLDNIKNGYSLLTLYKATKDQKYFKAATLLWDQLQKQPRTKEGGFWHKKRYPNQMWLDGLYMSEPFYARYATLIHNTKAFDDIANQFIYAERNTRDVKTGLLYHGWDESKQEAWANKETGRSPHVWARAMGWYAMALVDVLDHFPENHPKRQELINILNRTVTAIQKVQDPKSGLWYDIIDVPNGKGNYFEASGSCMFVYAIAKGVRKGYLPKSFFAVASKGYKGIRHEFVEQRSEGKINIKGTVSVSGLGGKPYRDGSYEYYMKEKVVTNDLKGVGSFLKAANEMEIAAH